MRTFWMTLLLSAGLAAAVVGQETPPPEPVEPASDVAPGSSLSEEDRSRLGLKLMTGFMSPYCPGANLRDCGSGQAEVLRQRIRNWVAEGRSEAWITEQMVAEFGETILGAPRFQGWGIIAYVAPVLALLLGLSGILLFLQKQKDVKARRAVDDVPLPEDYQLSKEAEQRVDRELELRSR